MAVRFHGGFESDPSQKSSGSEILNVLVYLFWFVSCLYGSGVLELDTTTNNGMSTGIAMVFRENLLMAG